MLKFLSRVRLKLNVIRQQRETPRRRDNKVIARRHQEIAKPEASFFQEIPKKY
jgi:hypothetical protein